MFECETNFSILPRTGDFSACLTVDVQMTFFPSLLLYVCRIFQFENFKRTKKRVLEEDDIDGALVRFKCLHRGEIFFWNSYESIKEEKRKQTTYILLPL